MGRVKKDIGQTKQAMLMRALLIVETCLQYKATWDQCDTILRKNKIKTSLSTISRAIKDKYNCTFEELRSNRMNDITLKLHQKAVQMALNGNSAMMIFCLKNLAGWKDKIDIDEKIRQEIIFRARIGENGALLSEAIDVTPDSDAETLELLGQINKHTEANDDSEEI